MAVIPIWVKKCNNAISPVLSAPRAIVAAPRPPATPGRIQCRLVGPKKNSWCRPGPQWSPTRVSSRLLQVALGVNEASGCVETRWSPKCPTLESVAYMASEEGVDHQEAHFRPALLLRGIPADLDPASGRAVLQPTAGDVFFIRIAKSDLGRQSSGDREGIPRSNSAGRECAS